MNPNKMSDGKKIYAAHHPHFQPLLGDLAARLERYIVVEYKRYDRNDKVGSPDGWVFYCLTPDENGSEVPFRSAPENWKAMSDEDLAAWLEEEQKHSYRGRVDGWMRQEPADEYRQILVDADLKRVPLAETPEGFRAYVQACALPLEWQSDEGLMAARTTVWLAGEWPA